MKKILIVDDNISLCQSIMIGLKKYNYQVDTVYNGEEALQRINDYQYDTMITDIYMPGMNGVDLACRVFAENPQIKIILMSAKDIPEISGPFKKIQKPFKNSMLLELIENNAIIHKE